MPEPGSTRVGRLLVHTPIPAQVAREIVEWTRAQGLDPHLNHLERFILRADDPNADDYSAFMGARAELVADLAGSIRHPITKVLAVGEPPLPTELAPLAQARFAGVADVTISHPKFLEFVAPGVSKGRAVRWLAPPGRGRWERRWRSAINGTTSRCSPEVGHGAAMPTAPLPVQAAARYIAPALADEGVARMIEMLVLASPAAARAASDRLAGRRRSRSRPPRRRAIHGRWSPRRRSWRDGQGRSGRCGRPSRGDRGAAGRRRRGPADGHGLRHLRGARDARWRRAPLPREAPAAGQGDHAAAGGWPIRRARSGS